MFKIITSIDRKTGEEHSDSGILESFKFSGTDPFTGIFTFQDGKTVEVLEFPNDLKSSMNHMGLNSIQHATIDLTKRSIDITRK